MRPLTKFALSLFVIALFASACSEPTPQPATSAPQSGIANPASVNCVKQGGTTQILTRGDGSQYGVCVFAGNKQCEEWALMRGECPASGLAITAYVSKAAQYCVLSGGTYAAPSDSKQGEEQGTCAFKNGKTCNVGDYFNGKCGPNH
jgi:hypothetical protein